ncbi:ferric-chelate reductase 1-like [Paramacrobiotus metropolitanus]|uniref:ferric-chelate reductase 1-like n=1 Tax=Paramacrobiotus metropolitanus TaxID=2943436 RepID=UPI002445E8E8|nr:ferric-chelate reductase 1-like [Paramacrobiotus metropolitanus]
MDYGLIITGLVLNSLLGTFCLQELAKGCGSNGKHCIGRPHDCIPDPRLCQQLAAVTTLSASLVHVELRSKGHLNRNRWLALGFSEDENMGRDAVIHCIQNGTFTEAQLTYNPEHLNIQGLPQAPVHVTEATVEDDVLHCALDLDKKFIVQEQEFDLHNSHHLLFSTGPVKAGQIMKHDKVPIISTEAYAF